MSVDGTMVALKQRSSTQTAADSSNAAGASDTESNSERDNEVPGQAMGRFSEQSIKYKRTESKTSLSSKNFFDFTSRKE